MIEPSINSVRVSVQIKQTDDVDSLLTHMFMRFLMQRAEQFVVLRRKAVEVMPLGDVVCWGRVCVGWAGVDEGRGRERDSQSGECALGNEQSQRRRVYCVSVYDVVQH